MRARSFLRIDGGHRTRTPPEPAAPVAHQPSFDEQSRTVIATPTGIAGRVRRAEPARRYVMPTIAAGWTSRAAAVGEATSDDGKLMRIAKRPSEGPMQSYDAHRGGCPAVEFEDVERHSTTAGGKTAPRGIRVLYPGSPLKTSRRRADNASPTCAGIDDRERIAPSHRDQRAARVRITFGVVARIA